MGELPKPRKCPHSDKNDSKHIQNTKARAEPLKFGTVIKKKGKVNCLV
jgi:hypothetical protein